MASNNSAGRLHSAPVRSVWRKASWHASVYTESGLDEHLGEDLLFKGDKHYLFGDAGYAIWPHLLMPFVGVNITQKQALFNKRMCRVRVSVERTFKDVKKQFSRLFPPKNGPIEDPCRSPVHGKLSALELQMLPLPITDVDVLWWYSTTFLWLSEYFAVKDSFLTCLCHSN